MSNSRQLDLKNPRDFEIYAMDNFDCLYMGRVEAISTDGRSISDPERTTDTWRSLPSCVIQLANTAMGFPLALSKRVNWKAAFDETCWMMRGETNINTLNSKIWDEWADENGECGPIYGAMWRRWPDVKVFPSKDEMAKLSIAEQTRFTLEMQRFVKRGARSTILPDGRVLWESEIDQLLEVLNSINARSRSRRIHVQTFNPSYLGMQALPPCHTAFEFNVMPATEYENAVMRAGKGEAFEDTLHLSVQMRSSDTLLGFPFNMAGYCMMLHLFAKYCNLNVGSITIDTTNTHVYDHHWDALKTQAQQFAELREEVLTTGNPMQYPLLEIDPIIHTWTPEELLNNVSADLFTINGYNPKGAVKGRVTK